MTKRVAALFTRGAGDEAEAPLPIIDPRTDEAEWFYRQGIQQRRAAQLEEALTSFARAVELKWNHVPALAEQGALLLELGRPEEAADSLSLALAFDPKHAPAWLSYGRLLRQCRQIDGAIEHLLRAVELDSRNGGAWLELGLTLNQAGHTGRAADAYESAIAAAPSDPGAYINLGLLQLAQIGDPSRAESFFRRAVELDPKRIDARINLGLALHEQGRSKEALALYDEVLSSEPGCIEARWHRATVLLALGCYDRGWDDYEARKRRGERHWRHAPPLPEWDGTPLVKRPLLVYGEQGLGDEIMFASCLPDLIEAGARCVVHCDSRLGPLFQRSFPEARVHGAAREAEGDVLLAHPELEVQCAIGTLPRFFRRSRDAFTVHDGYLIPDKGKLAHWREKLAQDQRLKVGIAWRAGTFKTRSELRSIPLSHCDTLLQTTGVSFYALQSGWETEIEPEWSDRLHTLTNSEPDLDDLAAIICALDLVISVQGTTGHLAGALGRPVWILLNHSSEWRYLNKGERMPWYPSARLFRQSQPGGWAPLLQEVAVALASFKPESGEATAPPRLQRA